MSKKLAVLGTVLVLTLTTAMPGLAAAQDEVPACVVNDACPNSSEEQQAVGGQDTESPEPAQPLPVTPTPEIECDGDSTNPCSPNGGTPNTGNTQSNSIPEAAFDAPASCGSCGLQVAQTAKDALTGDGGSGDADPANAFGAALQAARDTGATREAAAFEEAGTPVEDTAVYRAAFKAAKEAGADNATAKEAALRAVAEAEKVEEAAGQTSKDGTDSEEEATTEEEAAAAGGEDGGSGGEDTATTPAGRGFSLLLGGVALLSVGGYATLGFARSRSSSGLRRPLRN